VPEPEPVNDPVNCKTCNRPTRRVVHVLVDGTADAGPYGRVCARRIVQAYTQLGVAATRRYGRA
jgi:hypothetical protein